MRQRLDETHTVPSPPPSTRKWREMMCAFTTDADAGHQGRDLPARRPAGLLAPGARPFRLPDPLFSSPTTRRPRCAGRGARQPVDTSASCRCRSRPMQHRGGRCWRAVTPTLSHTSPPRSALSGHAQRPRARHLRLFVLARMEPEVAGDERALISTEELVDGLSRNRISGALAKAGLPAFTSVLGPACGRRASLPPSSCRA